MRLIDADIVKEYLKRVIFGADAKIDKWVDCMPDVDPVVHGRWTRSDDNSSVSCSECHMPLAKTRVKYADIGYDGYCFIQTKYCPHCGAKMDGDPGPIRISHGELVQMEREAKT